MERQLLTYNEPLLLTYSKPKRNIFKSVLNIFYEIAIAACIILSCIFVIDSVHSDMTDNLIRGIYTTIDFFAPDLELFGDNTKLGFVSKMMDKDFRVVKGEQNIKHIIDYDEITLRDNTKLVYTSQNSGRLFAPVNAIVKSIDFEGEKCIITLSYNSGKNIIAIESNLIFGLKQGQYIKQGSLIGGYISNAEILLSFYADGKPITDPMNVTSGLKWI